MRITWQWLPWKFLIRRLARAHGFLDPVLFLSRFGRLARPAEVAAPVELLRASIVFHARGLLNARTLQTNLDWIWPFWVQRQFDPTDPAFVPRSYTITHVNLSHRNWTAVGLPDLAAYPVVDPRGLVTPFFDGWSVDGWILRSDGRDLLPPRLAEAEQTLVMDRDQLAVRTMLSHEGATLRSEVSVVLAEGRPVCRVDYAARSPAPASLEVSLRPCNPEGVRFVHDLALSEEGDRWSVDEVDVIRLDPPAEAHRASSFDGGDVHRDLSRRPERKAVHCPVGMASGAARYALAPETERRARLTVQLDQDPAAGELFPAPHPDTAWSRALEGVCGLRVPDERIQHLWDAAIRSLILHSPLEIYPGPFYYKRFWFRDAAFILYPMLALGMHDRAERLLRVFPDRQDADGYFRSQQGEWDSNGQVMWIMGRFAAMTGRPLPPRALASVVRAGRWIQRKRTSADPDGPPHAGLLPAGFSAEHLGHNDFYYWDDFWAVAGLRAGATLLTDSGEAEAAGILRSWGDGLMARIEESLAKTAPSRNTGGVPASPYRRMDAGAVGSLVAGYPLRIWPADDSRLLATANHLLDRHFIENAFFQDMFHAGYNVYLSLHCAQVLLRAGDPRFFPIVSRMAELASPTGQWPEAIHPRTLGGCQGDGQHIWAAAEWLMMLRNLFVMERADGLDLLAGVPPDWLEPGEPLEIGPVHTPYGPIHLSAVREDDAVILKYGAEWRNEPPNLRVRSPGQPTVGVPSDPQGEARIPMPRPF